jgi:hypothetical protein
MGGQRDEWSFECLRYVAKSPCSIKIVRNDLSLPFAWQRSASSVAWAGCPCDTSVKHPGMIAISCSSRSHWWTWSSVASWSLVGSPFSRARDIIESLPSVSLAKSLSRMCESSFFLMKLCPGVSFSGSSLGNNSWSPRSGQEMKTYSEAFDSNDGGESLVGKEGHSKCLVDAERFHFLFNSFARISH